MTYVIEMGVDFATEICCTKGCAVAFAMPATLQRKLRGNGETFYCPHGHGQHYTGKSDEQKLREAEARNTHLTDQLRAAIRDAESSRQALQRERSRFAAGVCPCCTRSFENVRRHMRGEHPDYDLTRVKGAPVFRCECGQKFETFRGLRTHQGWQRSEDWDKPNVWRWSSHLTVVS